MAESAEMMKNKIADIEHILGFLPMFEAPTKPLYEVDSSDTTEPYVYAREVYQFIAALHVRGFMVMFEWVRWTKEARKYEQNPELLQSADLLTLGKLVTTHFYLDKFVSGHLAALLDKGYIAAILHRYRDIGEELKRQQAAQAATNANSSSTSSRSASAGASV